MGAFTVAPGGATAFRVYVGPVIVVATGTDFAVRAYPGDRAVTVVVTQGSVEVRHDGQTDRVRPGGSLVVPDHGAARAASVGARAAAAAWRRDTLAIIDQPLRRVLPELQRWYGLDIRVPQPTLLDRAVTLRAPLDSSAQAIHAVERSAGVQFDYVDSTMVFREPTHP